MTSNFFGKHLRLPAPLVLGFGVLALSACASTAPPEPTARPTPATMPPPRPVQMPQPVPQPQMIVVRGSANALAWYPMGRKVSIDARICLPENARFVTFERLDGGGQITYGGGACNRQVQPPPKKPGEVGGVWRGR